MLEAFIELATRCIGPFMLSEVQGESFITLLPKEILLVDGLRRRLSSILEEKAETELKLQKELASSLPSTMQWSAKIHTIVPGRDIRIPVPCLPEEATLEWYSFHLILLYYSYYDNHSMHPFHVGLSLVHANRTI
jgi:hypothetical protein